MQELQKALKAAAKDLFEADVHSELTRPDEQFGDYATNVALQLGAELKKNPRQIAVAIAAKLHGQPDIEQVNVAGAGFINIKLTDKALAKMALCSTRISQPLKGQEILIEFGDPNPFKEMHIGHLYSYIVGDSISRLLEASGAKVKRLSYHGDVGLHVAKTIWAMQQPKAKKDRPIGEYYAKGDQAYQENLNIKDEIDEINQLIYSKADSSINKLYELGRQSSFAHFDEVLQRLKIKTDKRYLESQASVEGTKLVEKHISSVFKKSQGAIVYEGEKAGLHTRVFITSKGLPTYETKDLGLAKLKGKDYPAAAKSIIITAHEQSDYFKVMLAALQEIDTKLAGKTTHLYHGFLTLTTGKMSSRKGDVYTATKLMDDVGVEAKKMYKNTSPEIIDGAIKYGFLKHRLGSDIVYDPKAAVSLEGDSGPYLQYAHARASSILSKSSHLVEKINDLEVGERSLVRKISEYPEVVGRAANEMLPSHVASYLYELAQSFNSFYEKNRVIGDERQAVRTGLVKAYAEVLKNGLNLLNIEAPERV